MSQAADTLDSTPGSRLALAPGGPWSPAYRVLTAGMLLTIGGAAFEALAVATILPAAVDDLDGLRLYGWGFSAFFLANLVGIVVAGAEADLAGPARPFAAGVVLFVAGLLLGGLAPTMLVFILGRAVQGLGGGIISSVAYVAVGRGYPDAAKPRMLALMSTAWVVPGLIGPGVAGVVGDSIGWRWIFLGLAPPVAVAAALTLPSLRLIPGGNATERDRVHLLRAVQLAGGTGLLLTGLGAGSVLLAVPALAVGGGLGWDALRRLLPTGTLRAAPGLPAGIATMGLLSLAFFGVDAFVPLTLVEVRDRSAAFAGLALTAATITWTTGSWLQARYVHRVNRRALVRFGLGLVALGSAGIALLLSPSVPATVGIVAWGVAGLGIGLSYSTISLVTMETAPPGEEGAVTSTMPLASALGVALGAGIGGALIAAFGSDDEPATASLLAHDVSMIGVVALAVVVAGRLPQRPVASSAASPTVPAPNQ